VSLSIKLKGLLMRQLFGDGRSVQDCTREFRSHMMYVSQPMAPVVALGPAGFRDGDRYACFRAPLLSCHAARLPWGWSVTLPQPCSPSTWEARCGRQ
jgi:hypothetical protein